MAPTVASYVFSTLVIIMFFLNEVIIVEIYLLLLNTITSASTSIISTYVCDLFVLVLNSNTKESAVLQGHQYRRMIISGAVCGIFMYLYY